MTWVCEDSDHPDAEPGRSRGLLIIVKILAHQAVVVLSYFQRLLVRGGRIGLRFWKNEA